MLKSFQTILTHNSLNSESDPFGEVITSKLRMSASATSAIIHYTYDPYGADPKNEYN
jgi:hypothetical protein